MKLMMKYFGAVVFSILVALNSSAEAMRGNLDCEFDVNELVYSRRSDGNIDHGIYYANINGCDVMIILCHGGVSNGTYGIYVDRQFRSDYSRAVSELIDRYNRSGKFRSISNIDIVLLGTCHAGYASNIILPRYVKLPGYGIPMCTVIDYKGELFFRHRNGTLRLYTDRRYKEAASPHARAMAKFLGGSNGRYREINKECEIPDDAIKLSGDF